MRVAAGLISRENQTGEQQVISRDASSRSLSCSAMRVIPPSAIMTSFAGTPSRSAPSSMQASRRA